jgi:hypothetical protein
VTPGRVAVEFNHGGERWQASLIWYTKRILTNPGSKSQVRSTACENEAEVAQEWKLVEEKRTCCAFAFLLD